MESLQCSDVCVVDTYDALYIYVPEAADASVMEALFAVRTTAPTTGAPMISSIYTVYVSVSQRGGIVFACMMTLRKNDAKIRCTSAAARTFTTVEPCTFDS